MPRAKKQFVPKGNVHYETRNIAGGKKVAVLSLDNPPMNPLSSGIRIGLDKYLKEAAGDAAVAGIVITGKNKAFCAGADISEFSGGMGKGPNLVEIINRIEANPKPTVAALNGVALGGGCEVALGCHYRVAVPKAMVGLPEVNLGLLPGAGGTQRMPRLIGAEKAIDVMCTGAPLPAAKAKALGILDDVVADGDDIVAKAVDFIVGKLNVDLATRRLCNRTADIPAGLIEKARKKYAGARRGETAPQAIITCVEHAGRGTFMDGMKTERSQFVPLLAGNQSKAMQYMFFAERACWKVPGLTAQPAPLKKIGIIGAGLMGGGIAMSCASAGLQVVMIDSNAAAVEKGLAIVKKNYASTVKKGKLSEAKAAKAVSLMTNGGADYNALADCDLVVEAVYENMGVKKEVFKKLDAVCKPGAILASNTSYLSIDEMAAVTSRPQDVVGCHFFSPANVMKLLENVRGAKTSDRTIATAMAFGKRIGKICVLVNNCWGFVANRMMAKQGARGLLYGGCHPGEIDAAANAFGMRMGPMRMADLVGIDLQSREAERAGKLDPENDLYHYLYKQGNFGMKSGKGMYVYDAQRRATPNPDAEAFIAKVWAKNGVAKAALSPKEMADRLYLPVINEGFRCLEDGIVARASDIDIALVYGYAFPRYLGGPMKYAELEGLDNVLEGLRKMGEEPSKLLIDLVENGTSLAKWSKNREKALAAKAKL